jgi:hypothetical protein
MYRPVFADEVEIDFSSFGPGMAPMTMAADDYVAGVKPVFGALPRRST